MKAWRSTRSGSTATLTEALFQGPAADGGLYIPTTAPSFDAAAIARTSHSFAETALRMSIGLIGNEVPERVLEEIVAEALDFPVPLVAVGDDLHVLELFHGPTSAFKDVGARFMAALMDRLDPEPDRTRVVLVATSGDTGGAVAHAFARRDRFKVVVLFPEQGVSEEQRRLFTTLGGNVTAVALPGSFDDCQALVKAAFRDRSTERLGLTAANSINVGRLVPQTFYYVDAVRQGAWKDGCAFSVPSGNLGNLTGGLLAAMAGLPVRRLVSSLNVNDTLLRHLDTGAAEARLTRRTLSSAMDVSLPSNLERLSALTGGDVARLRDFVWARSFDDAATTACMVRMWQERGYLIDPHGAVGVLGAEAYRAEQGDRGPIVVLATAHPAKLPDVVEAAVGERPAPPPEMRAALAREERIVTLGVELPALLELLEDVSARRVGRFLRPAAVRVPGSSANLGAGFDCVGLAVDRFLDATFEPGPGPLSVVRPEGAPGGDDLVRISFERALAARGLPSGGVLRVRSGIPIGCGLGSSAAALVAGTALALAAAGDDLDPQAAFGPATAEEGHGDNTGASAFGGLIAVVGQAGALRVLKLELSDAVGFAFAAPPTRLSTRAARAALPASVPHGVATGSLARVAALLRGLATGDPYLLRQGFQDELHVPYRLPLILGADAALAAALANGGWAGTVSGAGSGLLAVCAPGDAERVAQGMAAAFAERHGAAGVVSFALHPEPLGVRALPREAKSTSDERRAAAALD